MRMGLVKGVRAEGDSDRRCASFDRLRMRMFLVPQRLPLILSLSKDAGWTCSSDYGAPTTVA